MTGLADILMTERWVWLHVKPCADRFLKRDLVKSVIVPMINDLLEKKLSEREFTKTLAPNFEKDNKEFLEVFACIEQKVMVEAEGQDVALLDGWAEHMCGPLLSKFFHTHCKKQGYATTV